MKFSLFYKFLWQVTYGWFFKMFNNFTGNYNIKIVVRVCYRGYISPKHVKALLLSFSIAGLDTRFTDDLTGAKTHL